MAKGIFVVRTAPTSPEQDAEYNAWYDDVHLADVLSAEGFVRATRYKIVEMPGMVPTDRPYLALYEIEADDIVGALAKMREMSAAGKFRPSSALSSEFKPETVLFEMISARP